MAMLRLAEIECSLHEFDDMTILELSDNGNVDRAKEHIFRRAPETLLWAYPSIPYNRIYLLINIYRTTREKWRKFDKDVPGMRVHVALMCKFKASVPLTETALSRNIQLFEHHLLQLDKYSRPRPEYPNEPYYQ